MDLNLNTCRHNWFPNRVGGVHGFGNVAPNRRPAANPNAGNTRWGRGQTLGTQ